MNIEYTKERLEKIDELQSAIHAQTIIARDASDRALRLYSELCSQHTQAATEHYKKILASEKSK